MDNNIRSPVKFFLITSLHVNTLLDTPPAENNVVHRSELFEELNSGLSRKLILVSAPAGYGKQSDKRLDQPKHNSGSMALTEQW